MATSTWIGTPPTDRRVNRQASSDRAAAYGNPGVKEEELQQQTGVDRGGSGYVSGQVMPASMQPTQRVAAPAATPAPAPPPAAGPVSPNPATPINSGVGFAGGFARNGVGMAGSSLATPAHVGGVTTQQSALSLPGSSQPSTASGTAQGTSPIPTGSSASPTVAVGKAFGIDVPDPGGHLLTPTVADLTPTQNAQAAAFGAGNNFDVERYNYRPGTAPSQERVALDTAKADQIRDRQLNSLEDLSAASRGAVPSAAELQMTRQAAKDRAANLAAARALGGRSAGGAARAATIANAEGSAELGVNAAALRAQEQAQARSALVAALSGTRGQDIDVSQSNAGLAQQANANNLNSQLDSNKLAEQHRLALIDAQLKALGIGTNAAVGQVNAAAKNAEAENASKDKIFNAGAAFLGL